MPCAIIRVDPAIWLTKFLTPTVCARAAEEIPAILAPSDKVRLIIENEKVFRSCAFGSGCGLEDLLEAYVEEPSEHLVHCHERRRYPTCAGKEFPSADPELL